MTKREFVSIALKLMAVYALIVAVYGGTSAISQFVSESRSSFLSRIGMSPQFQSIVLLPTFAQISISLFLWLLADALSILIVRQDGVFAGGVKLNEIKSVLFSVLGIWLIADAIVEFTRHLDKVIVFAQARGQNDMSGFLSLPALVQLIIGITLIYRSRKFSQAPATSGDWGRNQNDD